MLMKENNAQQKKWRKAKIVNVIKGRDNLVIRVEVKFKSSSPSKSTFAVSYIIWN